MKDTLKTQNTANWRANVEESHSGNLPLVQQITIQKVLCKNTTSVAEREFLTLTNAFLTAIITALLPQEKAGSQNDSFGQSRWIKIRGILVLNAFEGSLADEGNDVVAEGKNALQDFAATWQRTSM